VTENREWLQYNPKIQAVKIRYPVGGRFQEFYNYDTAVKFKKNTPFYFWL